MSTIGPILSWLDPTRDNAMLDAATVYLAPIFAIACCGAILFCGYVFTWIARRRSTLGVPRPR